MGLYSLICLMGNRLKQEKLLKIEKTAWYQKKHITFSDMLRAVRMAIWRDNLISRKGKIFPSIKNISTEMSEWTDFIIKWMLQSA